MVSKSPMDGFDSMQAASAEQFDRQSDQYGKSHILSDTTDVSEALVGILLPRGGRALDVATGGGHTALAIARLGWRVIAGDVSARMLENARKLLWEEGLELETSLFPAEQMPFPDNTFDLVTVRVAPHHFSSPEKFITEVARVLKSGGHFLLIDGTVPDNDTETSGWLHQVEKWRDPTHGRFLSPAGWMTLVTTNELRIVSSRLHYKKQPDLEWYFETAATPLENRVCVLESVHTASPHVRQTLRINEENGRIVWWWPILTLLARKG